MAGQGRVFLTMTQIKPPRIIVNGRREYLNRHLVEEKLGHQLRKNQVVHHINHHPRDNRLGNLKVYLLKLHTSLHHKNKVVPRETRLMISRHMPDRTGRHNPNYRTGQFVSKPLRSPTLGLKKLNTKLNTRGSVPLMKSPSTNEVGR